VVCNLWQTPPDRRSAHWQFKNSKTTSSLTTRSARVERSDDEGTYVSRTWPTGNNSNVYCTTPLQGQRRGDHALTWEFERLERGLRERLVFNWKTAFKSSQFGTNRYPCSVTPVINPNFSNLVDSQNASRLHANLAYICASGRPATDSDMTGSEGSSFARRPRASHLDFAKAGRTSMAFQA